MFFGRLRSAYTEYRLCNVSLGTMRKGERSRSASLVPSPPLPLTKWLPQRWSAIFGPIPWLASTHLEYFWLIKSPLDHMPSKPHLSLIREDIGDDSQTFLFGFWICHRTGSQSWTIHNPRKNAYNLRLFPIQLRIRGLCVVFGRHVTKQRSDWPELFGKTRTKERAQRYTRPPFPRPFY